MAVKKDKSIKLPPELKNKIDNYIGVTNAHFDLDDKHKEYKGNIFDTASITGIRRLMDIREEAAKTPNNKGAKMIIGLADSHLKDPANAGLVEKANEINRKYAETAKKVADLTNEVHRDGINNGNRLRDIYEAKKLGGGRTLRFYRSTVATMQYFNKDSDEEILKGMCTLMNDPEKAAPETKKKMARELEKLFKGIMEFDNKKCEYESYEELWTDPKHKDFSIMTSIASECEPLLSQYKILMKDPVSGCALDEKMFNEVKSKVSLLEETTPATTANSSVSNMYRSSGLADFDIEYLPDKDGETIVNKANAINDYGLLILGNLAVASKFAIQPNENIGLEMKDGKPQITSLPADIVKIKQSDAKELQAYRDKTKSELGVLNVAKDAVEPVAGWAKKMVKALNEAHPYTGNESNAYKNMYNSLGILTNIDSGSGLFSIKSSLGKMIETASAFEKENSGLFGNSTLTAFAQKMRSFAECKLPEFNGLSEKVEKPTYLSGSISQRIETLRRIDKEAELRGITLDKKDELSFAPETDRQRIDAVGGMLENAKKGVMFGSKEYDKAAKSYAEMARAYKSFRDIGGNAGDEERMNAIEAYQEAANKARADIEKYMKYRQAKGAMENNKDVKTQRRIDAMTAALNAVRDTNAFMDDRYTEVSGKILKAENTRKYLEENQKITEFCMDMEKDPKPMKHIVKGADGAMDKLQELSRGNNDVPLTPKELQEAKKAMATLTLYMTIQHGRKNNKNFDFPATADQLEPMTNDILNRPAFQKTVEDITTREQLRNVMVDPDVLRVRYTFAKLAEIKQQKQNAERQPVLNEPNNRQQNNDLNRNNNRNNLNKNK